MANVDITVQNTTRTGLRAVYNSGLVAADSYFFVNADGVIVHIKNGVTPGSVTIESVGEIDGLAIADRVVGISANVEEFIGPFPGEVYNNSDRMVKMNFATPATMELAVIKVE